MRGYSDTKPDGNPARSAQSLRRQFVEIYDVNLDRNNFYTHVLGVSFANAMRELLPSNTP
jgi:hypothetical protein